MMMVVVVVVVIPTQTICDLLIVHEYRKNIHEPYMYAQIKN